MPERNRSGRGTRRRAGGDGEPDLFAQQLASAVQKAFAAAGEESGLEGGVRPEAVGAVCPQETLLLQEAPERPPQRLKAEGEGLKGDTAAGGLPENEAVLAEAGVPVEKGTRSEPGVESRGPADFPREGEVLQARMLNEYVYCPRLFYYEHVEGVFVESADTMKGAAVHKKVDKGKGALERPKGAPIRPAVRREAGGDGVVESVDTEVDVTFEKEARAAEGKEEGREWREKNGDLPGAEPAEVGEVVVSLPDEAAGRIHSSSVMLGSDRLGVVAKMDLVEATLTRDGSVSAVQPVDYKVGAPREGTEGLELWDADRMQLGLQCLVLRDNGYACDSGVIYYRKTKQRVPLEFTPELEAWVLAQIAAARVCARGTIPEPLVDSPKCVRCSLAPVCLPDETRMLSTKGVDGDGWVADGAADASPSTLHPSPSTAATPPPRRLMAPRDEKRALYLNTQGYRVGCHDGVLKVKEKDRLVEEVRVMDVCHVALFGNIQMSTQAIRHLCEEDIPVTWFSMGGWFYGVTRGHSMKNVLVRIEQFRHAADPASCLRLAQQFVRGKIHNHRVIFMRNHAEPPERTKLRLGQAREDALGTKSLEALLGVEGAAAAEYFRQFGGMIRERIEDGEFLEGIAPPAAGKVPEIALIFDFNTRNRRPPTDPVNALLSLAYSLLAKECTIAAYAVGLDPYVGFYHQPRHGRPALALDVMEEFRPLIAESAVLTAINNRYVTPGDFVSAGRAVNLNQLGRRQFIQCFEQRMNAMITHPVFDYKVSYRRALELQFRILARVLTGEIPEYVPFITR